IINWTRRTKDRKLVYSTFKKTDVSLAVPAQPRELIANCAVHHEHPHLERAPGKQKQNVQSCKDLRSAIAEHVPDEALQRRPSDDVVTHPPSPSAGASRSPPPRRKGPGRTRSAPRPRAR